MILVIINYRHWSSSLTISAIVQSFTKPELKCTISNDFCVFKILLRTDFDQIKYIIIKCAVPSVWVRPGSSAACLMSLIFFPVIALLVTLSKCYLWHFNIYIYLKSVSFYLNWDTCFRVKWNMVNTTKHRLFFCMKKDIVLGVVPILSCPCEKSAPQII